MNPYTNSPGMRRIVAALTINPGMIAIEIAKHADMAEGTTESYIRPLIQANKIHISGWRDSKKFHGIFVREFSAGPQIGAVPDKPKTQKCDVAMVQPPGAIPRDGLLLWALGHRVRFGVSA